MTKEEKLENLGYHETSQDGLWLKDAPIGCLYIDVVKNERYIELAGNFYEEEELEKASLYLMQVKHDYEEVMKLEDKVMFNTEELKDYGDDVCNGLENILEEDVDENYLNDDERQVLEKALAVIKSKMEELL